MVLYLCMKVTLTVLSDKECLKITKSKINLSYRAMVTRELCAAKKNNLTLRVLSEKKTHYSELGSREHFLWGGSDACQVTSDAAHIMWAAHSWPGGLGGPAVHPDRGQGRAHRGGQQGRGVRQTQLRGSVRQVGEAGTRVIKLKSSFQGSLITWTGSKRMLHRELVLTNLNSWEEIQRKIL